MARSLRIEFKGAFYHVMARGNQKKDIFFDDEDRWSFLQTLQEARDRTGWGVHAWVLMNNHYHLLLQTPHANLVEGMKWLQNAYTRRLNGRHRLWGTVFGDRYKAVLVEGESRNYLSTLLDYIHLNPARAGIAGSGEGGLLEYPWSSLSVAYATGPEARPRWMSVELGLAAFGMQDTGEGRKAFVERLERRALEESTKAGIVPISEGVDARLSHLRRGWYWGSQAFSETAMELGKLQLQSRADPTLRATLLRHAHDEDAAEGLVTEALGCLGLGPEELIRLNGSDPRKVAIAAGLKRNTSVSLAWISGRLKMKSAANVSQQLRKLAQGGPSLKQSQPALSEKLSGIFP